MPKAFRKRGSKLKSQQSVDKGGTEQTGAAAKGAEATAATGEEIPMKTVEENLDSKDHSGSEENRL